ncbi:MAG: carbohydrate ABC transporter permease [Microbacteriaceae bacterium]|nr:carbohydrate ABC transporter permease [Microbacteriaceae bacterium]
MAPGQRPAPVANAVIMVVLVVATLLTLFPFVLALLAAFTPRQQFVREGLTLPLPPSLENFAALGETRVDFTQAFWVTVAVVVVVAAGQLLFSVTAAYAFARMRFPGRELWFWVVLATLMVPQAVTVIPLYVLFAQIGLPGTFLGLVLPYLLGSPYAVFLLREQFRQIPEELIDAMRMDGGGTLRILFGLVVPLSRPTLVTLLLITVVTHWNNFMWPLMIGRNRIHVLTTAAASLNERFANTTTLVMAAAVAAMLPLIVLFAIFQRQIVRSIRITGFR